MKKEINLIGKELIASYVDIMTLKNADSDGFLIGDEKTVADVYVKTAQEYMDKLLGDGFEVTEHGVQCKITECLYYIKWLEEYDDDYDVEHKELLGLYTDHDDEMVLVPYSHDPVTAARYIEHEDV